MERVYRSAYLVKKVSTFAAGSAQLRLRVVARVVLMVDAALRMRDARMVGASIKSAAKKYGNNHEWLPYSATRYRDGIRWNRFRRRVCLRLQKVGITEKVVEDLYRQLDKKRSLSLACD